jgi:hypothetical protein
MGKRESEGINNRVLDENRVNRLYRRDIINRRRR